LEEGLISQEWLLPRVEEELRVLVD
jgi:hypothetical protein